MAENVGFVKCFLREESYRKLIGNFYFVYSAMEEEMERHRQHPILSKIYFQELNRQTWNKTSATTMDPTGEQIALSQPVKSAADSGNITSAPELLIASYTRYIGDLSGGQIQGHCTTVDEPL